MRFAATTCGTISRRGWLSRIAVRCHEAGMSASLNPRDTGLRLAAFYGALFVVYGMHVPYTPVWLDWAGLTALQISLVLSLPYFVRLFVTPTVALAADRQRNHRTVIIALAWLSLALVLTLSQMPGFWLILLVTVPLIVANSTIMPLIETLAADGVRTQGLDYGRVRLWGSLTFIAASFAGGVAVNAYGGGAGIWLVTIGCVLTVLAAHLLPTPPINTTQPDSTPEKRASLIELFTAPEPRQLLSNPAFRWFLLAAGCAQAAHATLLGFASLIWQAQGLGGTWTGILWAIGVLAEVAVFAWSGALIKRIGIAPLLIAGATFSILRWGAMAFEPGLYWLIPLQALHGITFGATHVAAIHFMQRAVPREIAGTGQALYATVSAGLAMGTASLIAGAFYAQAGSLSYLAMGAISVISLYGALRLSNVWQPDARAPEPEEPTVPVAELAP
jgi:MFS transporter, PPP family, 3-phenylpropionic acid transporter